MIRRLARVRVVFCLSLIGACGLAALLPPQRDGPDRAMAAESIATDLAAQLALLPDLESISESALRDALAASTSPSLGGATAMLRRPGQPDAAIVGAGAAPGSAAAASVRIVRDGSPLGVLSLWLPSDVSNEPTRIDGVMGGSGASTTPDTDWGIALAGASRSVLLPVAALAAVTLLSPRTARRRGAGISTVWSEAQSRVTQTLDFLTTGVVIIDRRARVVFVNRAIRRRLGLSSNQLLGRPVSRLNLAIAGEAAAADPVQPAPWTGWMAMLGEPGRGGAPARAAGPSRVAARTGSGEVLAFQASCLPIRSGKRTLGVLIGLDDVTVLETQRRDLARARNEADHANQAKSAFLANMSHEIRTPINGVMGMLELLRSTHLEARQREYAVAAGESAGALLHLINDILDLSKIEAGKLELSPVAFRPEECLASALRVVSQAAAAKGIELVLRAHEFAGLFLVGDPERLRQVAINLASNAIKFTSHGHVEVRAQVLERTGAAVRLRVQFADTGIGIPPERRDRLFRSFSQVDASTSRKYGGTGLGLAICRQLVHLMGGTIGVDSEPGHGSTFHFEITLSQAGPAEARAESLPEIPAHDCFILDSHAASARAMCECLESLGLACRSFESESALLTAIERRGSHDVEVGTPAAQSTHGRVGPLVVLGSVRWESESAELAGRIAEKFPGTRLAALTLADVRPEAEAQCPVVHLWLRKPFSPQSLRTALSGQRAESVADSHLVLDPGRAASLSVLVAEDSPVGQVITREFLSALGVRATIVDRGDLAMQIALAGRFDLILMDCHLPEMDGFAATRAIRAAQSQRGVPRTPIVALTARAMEGDKQMCLDSGMDDYLSKPIQRGALAELISRVLGVPLVGPPSAGMPRPISDRSSTLSADRPELGAAQHLLPVSLVPPPPTGPAQPADDAPPLDVRALLSRCLNKPDLAGELLSLFETSTLDDLGKLAEAAEHARADAIEHAAHSIAGGAAQIGAMPLSRLARTLEHDPDGQDIERNLEHLRREFDRCVAYINTSVRHDLDSITASTPRPRLPRPLADAA